MTYNHHIGLQTERSRKLFLIGAAIAVGATIAMAAIMKPASALSEVIVTPSNTQGWSTADTNSGGTVSFAFDTTAPGSPHVGALKLTTDASNPSRAQYVHTANIALSSVTELSYQTKQNSASFPAGLPSYQLVLDTDGDLTNSTGFTTMVYEPYNNFGNAAVHNGQWQSWDVAAGTFWSSRNVAAENANGGLTAGAGGAPFYSLASLKAKYPNAVVTAYGINVGTYNPSYNVEADLFNFNGTTYNFEAVVAAGEITSPTSGEHVSGTLNLAANYVDNESTNTDGVQWAVRAGTCAASTGTVFGNVDGKNSVFSWDDNNFSATLDVRNVTPGEYCFVFNPVDDAGQPNVRVTQTFYIDPFYASVKDECKNNGWRTLHDSSDNLFKNQGQCVASVVANDRASFKRQ